MASTATHGPDGTWGVGAGSIVWDLRAGVAVSNQVPCLSEHAIRSRVMREPTGRVLIVDDDADIAGLVEDVLSREGYVVTVLREWNHESVRAVIEHVRPDCVLLDGEGPRGFGTSWTDAAWMTALPVAVPVIMFSVNQGAINEAQGNESERSQAAGFSSILPKPFDLDELVRVVALAVSQSPFRREP